MKNKLLLLLGILPAFVQAQITIYDTDMAQPGDIIVRHTDTLTTLSPGGSGPGQVWMMTDVTIHDTDTTTVLAASSTPYAGSFAGSNIAMTNDNASFLYFKQNSDSLVATGLAGDLLGTGTTITAALTPDLLLHRFPRTYGDGLTDTYTMDVTTNGAAFNVNQVRFKRKALITEDVDGWGTITTPASTFDALRLIHTEYLTDTIWVQVFPFTPWTQATVSVDTTVGYNWIAKETKLAVAEMTVDSVGNPESFTWTMLPSTPNEVDAGVSAQSVKCYPVPATDKVSFRKSEGEFNEEMLLNVWTPEGKKVTSLTVSASNSKEFSFDTGNLPEGSYFWELRNEVSGKTETGKMFIRR
ncbi:MAG: T9SS type A sorting domain-containing protein [Bacteroidia bacterium]|nr:T9SS type A sorting domain-containing protein [Bacteroidia bacterium]